MPPNDTAGSVGQDQPEPRREFRHLTVLAAAAAVILALLMAYSIVLLSMGLALEVVAGAEVVLCVLTVQVIRCLSQPTSPLPGLPRWSTLPTGGNRGAA